MLGVLTIKLYLLSKPVTPIVAGAVASKAFFDVLRCKDSANKIKNRELRIKNLKKSFNCQLQIANYKLFFVPLRR